MREKLTIVNAFVHDVATGTWVASLLLATIVQGELARPEWAAVSHLVPALQHGR